MTGEKHRIVIWPSGSNDVPDLPIVESFDVATKSTDCGADGVNQNNRPGTSIAIVGWVDETPRAVTTVAIGSIPLSSSTDSAAATICTQKISPAINLLAGQHPCKYSTNSHGCGHCHNCAIYQSLRLLGIVCNPTESERGDGGREDNIKNYDGGSDLRQNRHQIILYNQVEAQRWHSRYCIPHSQQDYPDGTWQRNALRMGEALNVSETLSLAMKNVQQCKSEDDKASLIKEETEIFADSICRTEIEPSIDRRHDANYFHSILSQSLLLLHLKSGRPHHEGNGVLNIFAQMPIFSMLRYFHTRQSSKTSQQSDGNRGSTSSSLFISLILDSLFGLIIGYILLSYPIPIIQRVILLWNNFHHQQWNKGLKWLESFPAGFKLNVALTHQMGKEVRLALLYHQKILSFLFPIDSCIDTADSASAETYNTITSAIPTALVRYLGLSTIIFGSRFFFSFAFDATRIALLHIHYLSSLFAACQRLELSTLTSLWRLFRGKKRNILRQRSDHLKYDHMQLLLGMVLFTICLFLFTTILVYHCFFATINFLAELCVCGLWWCGFVIVQGMMQCDIVVMAKRRNQNDTNDTWIGKGVQFLPVGLSHMSCIDSFLGNGITMTSDMTKIPILQKQRFEMVSQEVTENLFPGVVFSTKMTSTMKAVFPEKSGFVIVMNAVCSFAVSKLSRVVIFFRRLVFGSSCPIASTFVEICRLNQNNWSQTSKV